MGAQTARLASFGPVVVVVSFQIAFSSLITSMVPK